MFKKVIKWTAISLGTIIGGPLIVAFSLGVYEGPQANIALDLVEADFDEYLKMEYDIMLAVDEYNAEFYEPDEQKKVDL